MIRSAVTVIGAGYAGCAAAVTLAMAGLPVCVLEAGPVAGGRARRIQYQGVRLDNGLHILLGAYRETLRLMQQVGVADTALQRMPLRLEVLDALCLAAPRNLPAPWHLAWALLRARGLTAADKWASARLMRRVRSPHAGSVADLLRDTRQTPELVARLWAPLCIAALNTPMQTASAKLFCRVLADTLLSDARASDLLLPRLDLSALFPEPALAWVARRGGDVRLGARVSAIVNTRRAFEIDTQQGPLLAERVIIACGPREAATLLRSVPGMDALVRCLDAITYESIHSVYIRYPHPVGLPVPMLGLHEHTAQWLFDRQALCGQTGLLGAVISATGALRQQPTQAVTDAVVSECDAVLRRFGHGPQAPLWTKGVVEKFATFAARPDLQRPAAATGLPGLVLAGDYVDGPYPATLEGAVRSGIYAAQRLLDERR